MQYVKHNFHVLYVIDVSRFTGIRLLLMGRTAKVRGPVEDRVRKAIRKRLKRGEQERCAAAAGAYRNVTHGSAWLSHWFSGRQDATLDEIVSMARFVGLPLATVLGRDDVDPELLAAIAKRESAIEIRAFVDLPAPLRQLMVKDLPLVLTAIQAAQLAAGRTRAPRAEGRTKSEQGPRRSFGRNKNNT